MTLVAQNKIVIVQIIAVNGVSLMGLPYDEALSTLCAANGNIAITVSRGPPAPPPASTPAPTVLPAMPSTRPPPLPPVVQPLLSPSLASRTLSVVEEAQQEVNLEIQRANGLGLGLQLALLPVPTAPIVIREILPAGSVAVDGRLMVGDRLLTINGKDFAKSNDTEAAMDALLQGTDKPIHLRILRDVTTTLQDDDMYQVRLTTFLQSSVPNDRLAQCRRARSSGSVVGSVFSLRNLLTGPCPARTCLNVSKIL